MARQQAMDEATGKSWDVGNQMFGNTLESNKNTFGQNAQQGAFANSAAQQAFGQAAQAGQQNFDQRATAANQNFNQAATAGNQNFQQGQSAANFQNQVHQQQIADMLQQQGFGLNEINSILTGQQIAMPTMPNFSQASKSETPQLFNAAQANFNNQSTADSMSNANMQGLMQGGMSAAMMFSDRRLKKDVTFLGFIRGLKIYCWTYLWGAPGAGVMSDEVDPRFVVRHESGFDMVNYGALNA